MAKRYDRAERERVLSELAASGLSRAAFCRREGLCYATVGSWLKRSEQETAGMESAASDSPQWLELTSEDRAVPMMNAVRVRLGESVVVELPESIGLSELARFCREVSRGC